MAVTTAASSPKHRLRPRATLYSPPPSYTLNERVVQMRRSPGSKRTITSPRLTMSQRQSDFGRIVSCIFSSPSHPAAINQQYVTVNVVACGRRQEHRGTGNIARASPPAGGNPIEDLPASDGVLS